MDKATKPAKRSLSKRVSLMDDALNENSENEEQQKKESSKAEHFLTRVENTALANVHLNYKNKRVLTQFIRFIPDNIAIEANEKHNSNGMASIQAFVLSEIKALPVNNIIREFRKSDDNTELDGGEGQEQNDLTDMRQYSRHDDLYDADKEGIFIGKGVCFHNITTNDNSFLGYIDEFVSSVNRNGASLLPNKDVIEKPQVIRVGGQRYRLVFGHQRYCYLVCAYGLSHIYSFNQAVSSEGQDSKIYLENNTKTDETALEHLLSCYHTIREAGLTDAEDIKNLLVIKDAQWFRIKPFMEDPKLLQIVKDQAITATQKVIVESLSEVKRAILTLGHEMTPAMVYEAYAKKLDSNISEVKKTKSRQNTSKAAKTMRVIFPKSRVGVEKLLFGDVREWSKLDITNYDFSKEKDLKRYISDIMEEAQSSK